MNQMTDLELEALFEACDLDLSGFIEKDELLTLCADLDLTEEEFDEIFDELDIDRDGKISKRDFTSGFRSVSAKIMKKKRSSTSGSPLLRAKSFSFEETGSCKSDEDESMPSISTTTSNNVTSSLSSGTNSTGSSAPRNNKNTSGSGTGKNNSRKRTAQSAMDNVNKKEIWEKLLVELDPGFYQLSKASQEQVCEFYQQLHHADVPNILALFENLIVSMIKDIRQHQCENERLERSYKKEKESHSRHLRQLEEEMEAQMARVETRVRSEEKDKAETEKEDVKQQLETEIAELRNNLSKLQKLDVEVTKLPSDETKARIEELGQENRQMRSALTDAQTNLAILRSEIATLRQQYDEKCDELECEKQNMIEFIKEQDSLTRQVHLLQNANKKLHDTNDDLRAAIENAKGTNKRPFLHRKRPVYVVLSQNARARKNMPESGMINAYMASTPNLNRSQSYCGNSSLADELNMSMDGHVRKMLPSQDSCEIDSLAGDIDSGHSTMSTLRDIQDIESECEPISFEEEHPYKTRRLSRDFDGTYDSEKPESTLDEEMETEFERLDSLNSFATHNVNMEVDEVEGLHLDEQQLAQATDELRLEHLETAQPRARSLSPSTHCQRQRSSSPNGGRSLSPRPGSACSHCSECSRSSSRSGSRQRDNATTVTVQQQTQPQTRPASVKRKLPELPLQKPITGEPERMYKVVLAGDAAVGKSSFIMRLCKNQFVPNLTSTLGVDFQTKVLEVDGRVIALQLWDTAGQERFRSIAKSYFRRADGVLLLYDTTYERSFLNVREWVQAVEDGAQKKIPIMLCGNKSDLRDQYAEDGKRYVKKEEGQKLAKDTEALFIETSAKEGDNILEAVTELARMLRTNEDIEVKSVGLKLQDMKTEEKKGLSCCN